jgi:hypothetical protein
MRVRTNYEPQPVFGWKTSLHAAYSRDTPLERATRAKFLEIDGILGFFD